MTMNLPSKPLIRPCTLVYLVLMALTVVTWSIGRSGIGGLTLSLLVLGFAVTKGHLLADWFMGLRFIGGWWRWVVAVWLLLPGGLITFAFILSYRG